MINNPFTIHLTSEELQELHRAVKTRGNFWETIREFGYVKQYYWYSRQPYYKIEKVNEVNLDFGSMERPNWEDIYGIDWKSTNANYSVSNPITIGYTRLNNKLYKFIYNNLNPIENLEVILKQSEINILNDIFNSGGNFDHGPLGTFFDNVGEEYFIKSFPEVERLIEIINNPPPEVNFLWKLKNLKV